MRTGNLKYDLKPRLFFAAAGLLMLLPTLKSISAAQPPPRPVITGTIMLRDGQTVTLNRGSQDGLRKGDKLLVSHIFNGKMLQSGRLVVTRVNGTNAEARVTEQTGSVGPEDIVTLDTSVPVPASKPKPSEPTREVSKPAEPAREPTRQTPKPNEPAQQAPKANEPTRKTSKTPKTPVQPPPGEAVQEASLPLLPQFSTEKTSGVGFTFDFTNDNPKPFDTTLYRGTARLIFDTQEYRILMPPPNTPDLLETGKMRAVSFALTEFSVSKDSDVWPLKSGRHTALIKFGGKQYGPLTFDWHGDAPAEAGKTK